MSKKLRKYTGWGVAYKLKGHLAIIIVPAKNEDEAIEIFEAMNLTVKRKNHVRHVSVYKYPGPEAEEMNWGKMMRPIEDV